MEQTYKVVCIGGGHCNCQVLKLLKTVLPANTTLTLINEAPKSYYSGMLPGTVSCNNKIHLVIFSRALQG